MGNWGWFRHGRVLIPRRLLTPCRLNWSRGRRSWIARVSMTDHILKPFLHLVHPSHQSLSFSPFVVQNLLVNPQNIEETVSFSRFHVAKRRGFQTTCAWRSHGFRLGESPSRFLLFCGTASSSHRVLGFPEVEESRDTRTLFMQRPLVGVAKDGGELHKVENCRHVSFPDAHHSLLKFSQT